MAGVKNTGSTGWRARRGACSVAPGAQQGLAQFPAPEALAQRQADPLSADHAASPSCPGGVRWHARPASPTPDAGSCDFD